MKIKILLNDNKEKDIDMNQYSVSLTGLFFENKKNKEDVIFFKDIKRISFDSRGTIMQMVDAIISTCSICHDETGYKIDFDLNEFERGEVEEVV